MAAAATNSAKTNNYFSTVTEILNNQETLGNKINVGNSSISNIELVSSNGFPYDSSNVLIQIVVFTYFSNRVFKMGDNIKIKGFEVKNGVTEAFDLKSFINRVEGHYIVNIEKKFNTTNDVVNQGYLNTLYISPPGNIDFTKEIGADILVNELVNINSDTEIFTDTDSNDTTKNCKLINKSLQSNYVFKVITRKDDITNVMSSSNI